VSSAATSASRLQSKAPKSGLVHKLAAFRRDHISAFRGAVTIVTVLVLWQVIVGLFMQNSIAIASPTEIINEYVHLAHTGELGRDIKASAEEFVYGFALAIVVGVAIGLVMGANRAVHDYLDPIIDALYATPVIALGPLFILWLGIGLEAKVGVVFILAVLPIVINTESGIRTIDPNILETASAFSATKPQVFRKVMLPGALPLIVTGIRLGLGRGLLGVVAGEFFASQAGLGFLVLSASQVFNPAGVFVGITALAIAGVVLTWLLRLVERHFAPWRVDTGK
jgi:NitT/TauT family transport system permease protein